MSVPSVPAGEGDDPASLSPSPSVASEWRTGLPGGAASHLVLSGAERTRDGPDKIRVNVICPGAISTEIGDNTNADNADVKIPVEYPEGNIPLTGGKPGSAEQAGELIAFLASDEASHISGTEIWIDGAQSLLQG
jgi:NAD(P)-dependent dehydrogenase (short-subunit alcohol dehydrogenase family)